MSQTKSELIAELNDQFRAGKLKGMLTVTDGVKALSRNDQQSLMTLVINFTDFTPGDNPYGERDFGAVELNGVKYFWKIDYYDLELEFGSEDASDASITTRVLTVMRADEY